MPRINIKINIFSAIFSRNHEETKKMTNRNLTEKKNRIEEHGVSSNESNSDAVKSEEQFDYFGSSVYYSDVSDTDVSVGAEILNLEVVEPTKGPIEWGYGEDLVIYDF